MPNVFILLVQFLKKGLKVSHLIEKLHSKNCCRFSTLLNYALAGIAASRGLTHLILFSFNLGYIIFGYLFSPKLLILMLIRGLAVIPAYLGFRNVQFFNHFFFFFFLHNHEVVVINIGGITRNRNS